MYQFKGTLVVRKIFGKYGEFAIGSIQTPIGEFSVKQAELDEYEEGTYEGRFVISSIRTISGGFGTNKLIPKSKNRTTHNQKPHQTSKKVTTFNLCNS